MKEKIEQLKPIQNMMVLTLLVLLFLLTTQTSAIAQNFAPVPRTGQTKSYAAGDDGDLQRGVQWPDPRFTDNGDGTVTDHLTGLIWLKNANCFGNMNWYDALDVSNNLADGQCGLSDGSVTGDWRLPNIRELHSLIDFENYDAALPTGHPFQNVQSGNYRSSTSHPASGPSMLVGMDSGDVIDSYHAGWGYVWPVRGGKDPPNFAPVPRTGQTTSHGERDDGDLQMGVPWPDPRFTDNGDGTVTDHLTGLIWLKNANCFGQKDWNYALDVSNTLADGQCGLSDGSVTGDWRLPNIRELHSLIDFGKYPLIIKYPFNNVHYDYWASTTDAVSTHKAWHVTSYGFVHGYDKEDPWDEITVWPVRGGNAFQSLAEIIGTWSSGIWYWNPATNKWTKMYSGLPSAALAAGDFTGDQKADVASIWSSGLWFQNGDTLGWTQVYHTAPDRIAAGDISGDGVDEIIGCGGAWGKGVWYRDVANHTWHHPWSGPPSGAMAGDCPLNDTPDGPIAAGDVTGDGKADMVSCWDSGLWYQDGATLSWTKVWKTAPSKVTCGDVTGDEQAEIISTWSDGFWYWDVAASKWTKMTSYTTQQDIAAGDFTGDGKADVASIWSSGLWYQNGATLGWKKVTSTAPYTVTAGDVTGN